MIKYVLSLIVITLLTPAWAMEWQWLDQMRIAMQQQDYRGEFIVRQGQHSSAYAIAHQFQDGQVHELLRQLDGDMVEVLRTNEQIVCYASADKPVSPSQGIPAAPFSRVTALDLQRISQNYMIQHLGEQRIAGYLTDVLQLTGDNWRYQHKLWLERDSKMLLQSEVLDSAGQSVEQFRFSRLELGVSIGREELMPTLTVESARQKISQPSTEQASDQHFISQPEWLPAGAVLIHARQQVTESGWREQRTYSDGLASFSLFTESGIASVATQTSLMRSGATTILMADKWPVAVTVIGEIPVAAAQQLVQELSFAESTL